jgi:RNA polymerase sigma-70 factor (ECF subfamily)
VLTDRALSGRYTMRRILVDYARAARAGKRWRGQRIELRTDLISTEDHPADLLALDVAMRQLEATEPRQCRVVELLYFAGLTPDEAADVLGISSKTVSRDWKLAKAHLYAEMVRKAAI